jgi:hypothetical protein
VDTVCAFVAAPLGSGRSRTTGAVRREFDVVMAWSVDRLGLIDFLSEIHAAGVDPS